MHSLNIQDITKLQGLSIQQTLASPKLLSTNVMEIHFLSSANETTNQTNVTFISGDE